MGPRCDPRGSYLPAGCVDPSCGSLAAGVLAAPTAASECLPITTTEGCPETEIAPTTTTEGFPETEIAHNLLKFHVGLCSRCQCVRALDEGGGGGGKLISPSPCWRKRRKTPASTLPHTVQPVPYP